MNGHYMRNEVELKHEFKPELIFGLNTLENVEKRIEELDDKIKDVKYAYESLVHEKRSLEYYLCEQAKHQEFVEFCLLDKDQ